jgi:hypothetical protein
MALDLKIPCPAVPKIPKIPDINILGMADLKGFLDFSVGSPRDCTLTINLLLQLAPLLASMTCLLRILAVIKAMEKFVKNPLTETSELLDKIGKMAPCFLALTPINIAITIKGILQLIISFVSCFLEQLDSLISFQATIDLNSANGNPALQASLECATENAQNSMDNLMLSLEPLQPLLEMITSLSGIAGFDLKLPALSDLSAEQDHTIVIQNLSGAVASMKDAINALPG